MALALLAALMAGAFATTSVLWFTGVGGMSAQAMSRLQGLKGQRVETVTAGPGVSLRKRATVSLAGITLVSTNLAANWTADLERAGLTLTTKEYFGLRAGVAAVFAVLGMVFIPIPMVGLLLALPGFMAVGFWVKRRISKRRQKLEHQLVELLQIISSGLRAGFGFVQALESGGKQAPEPLSIEIRRTLRDIAVGASIEQALEALNKRVGSPDFDIVITAILIQRNVGGNLAEILDNVAHTMRERERIRGEIRTLTSQQRMTGMVIGFCPPALFVIFNIISPDFAQLLLTDPLGRMMLGAAVVMEVMGFLVIQKIVNIEV